MKKKIVEIKITKLQMVPIDFDEDEIIELISENPSEFFNDADIEIEETLTT